MPDPIQIVDLQLGNLRSVQKAFEALGREAPIVSTPEEVENARRLVLPGVGAFGDAMETMERSGLDTAIRDHAVAGRPLLGICLGLQVLFETGHEGSVRSGLGLLPGEVVPFPSDLGDGDRKLKVPHVGWNTLERRGEPGLLEGCPPSPYVYFVHSYIVQPTEPERVVATTHHGIEFCSIAGRENIVATQFHPEKSQKVGLQILTNWLELRE